ncbi:hypothetical protein CHRY9390_00252 [Chryseobacterium aquaeductus]|uniref:Uncharacterized protein n=1 Tax=Chryseobacterium aquaeductus TaxID=2675056 RepID=A0A9N8ME93_9FLAO|nr:hypothetical protein [Chryseobacterium aquaeductus]CAA7329613.1 hypothetical protein CHRY9390_00252 [Chryseobacterium potabilaquae]CAD7797934.1 hypothetical protein CHRY9390_00252 [Chryseobacterium aquaeductus]
MATKDVIEKKIEEIRDGGNNTAAEIRDVLTDLLNFKANVPSPSTQNVEFFHFWTEEKPVQDKFENFLQYSIKGIKDQWINLTFSIEINRSSTSSTNNGSNNIFVFPLQDQDLKLLEYLKPIVAFNEPTVRFIIPYTTVLNEQMIDYPLSTSIYFQENTIVFDFNNNISLKSNSELVIATGRATSSVSFHFPFQLKKMR